MEDSLHLTCQGLTNFHAWRTFSQLTWVNLSSWLNNFFMKSKVRPSRPFPNLTTHHRIKKDYFKMSLISFQRFFLKVQPIVMIELFLSKWRCLIFIYLRHFILNHESRRLLTIISMFASSLKVESLVSGKRAAAHDKSLPPLIMSEAWKFPKKCWIKWKNVK